MKARYRARDKKQVTAEHLRETPDMSWLIISFPMNNVISGYNGDRLFPGFPIFGPTATTNQKGFCR